MAQVGQSPAPLRSKAYKPGTRVEAAKPARPTGELPWYARVKPGESMMTAAKNEQDRMKQSKEAKRIVGRVND